MNVMYITLINDSYQFLSSGAAL